MLPPASHRAGSTAGERWRTPGKPAAGGDTGSRGRDAGERVAAGARVPRRTGPESRLGTRSVPPAPTDHPGRGRARHGRGAMTITMSEQVDAEPCDVLRGGDGPVYFLLGGRLYVVHEVLGRWIEPDVEPRKSLRSGPRTTGGHAGRGGGRQTGAGSGAAAVSGAGASAADAGAGEVAASAGSDDPNVPALPRARSGGGERGIVGSGRDEVTGTGSGGTAGVQATGARSTGQGLIGAYSSGAESGRAHAYGAQSNASEQSEPPQVEHWLVVASVGRYGTPAVFRLQRRPAPPANGPDTWTVRAERR